jgi:hypothetical protein
MGCGKCHHCLANVTQRIWDMDVPIPMLRMILCETCGNKRCPHATDCSLACTHSNEPGQPGSIYGKYPLPIQLPQDER